MFKNEIIYNSVRVLRYLNGAQQQQQIDQRVELRSAPTLI